MLQGIKIKIVADKASSTPGYGGYENPCAQGPRRERTLPEPNDFRA
jgi:hypothetical protein